ncbi:hypothetical protein ACJX0J_030551, partial [Zea mays]
MHVGRPGNEQGHRIVHFGLWREYAYVRIQAYYKNPMYTALAFWMAAFILMHQVMSWWHGSFDIITAVSTVKSTILEVGNIELFELNEVISSFLRIMLFFCILSSAVLPKNEKPITESGDEISYEGAKAKHPISLLLGLRRRSTAHVKFGPSHHERKESIGAPIKLDVEAHAHIQKHSPKASTNPLNISLTMEGGSVFPINDPIITITDTISNPMAYCLAAMKSEGVNLIGENFMSGLKVVFDRERNVLGWKNFDCYSVGNSRSNLLVNSNPSCVPPRPALGPNSYTPEATKGASPNGTQ